MAGTGRGGGVPIARWIPRSSVCERRSANARWRGLLRTVRVCCAKVRMAACGLTALPEAACRAMFATVRRAMLGMVRTSGRVRGFRNSVRVIRDTPRVNCGVTRFTTRVILGSIFATFGKAFAASGSSFDATSGINGRKPSAASCSLSASATMWAICSIMASG